MRIDVGLLLRILMLQYTYVENQFVRIYFLSLFLSLNALVSTLNNHLNLNADLQNAARSKEFILWLVGWFLDGFSKYDVIRSYIRSCVHIVHCLHS